MGFKIYLNKVHLCGKETIINPISDFFFFFFFQKMGGWCTTFPPESDSKSVARGFSLA